MLQAKPVAVETVSDEDLVKPVTLYLTETETFWMLDIPSTWVAADGPDADDVKASNERYEVRCLSTTHWGRLLTLGGAGHGQETRYCKGQLL